MSQRDLAAALDVTPSYVSRLESNVREPSVSLLRKIGRELKVPPGLLLATALLVDVPDEQAHVYEKMASQLLDLAILTQTDLWGRDDQHREPD